MKYKVSIQTRIWITESKPIEYMLRQSMLDKFILIKLVAFL
jgi:hypothetical protein